MIVNKIIPQGYCGGVVHALKCATNAINDNSVKPIYMLGEIIHNTHVIKDLENLGIITIEDKTKTRLELLDLIDSGTVIFSAHGVSPKVYEKAKNKKLNIIDATCPNVLIIHDKISSYLSKDYTCLYIGTKGHPECDGVLGISDKIIPIYSYQDILDLNILNDKIYVTNQTTLSIFDIENILNKIKEKYPNSIIDDKICNASTIRQQALANQPDADLCIIVGDNKSSNTKKLYKVSSEIRKIKTVLIEDLSKLDKSILENVKVVNISSGASTPGYIVDEIIEYLKKC